ncbi:DNA polymerase IV [Kingella kingae]|uniref:DNA polymerase IV n=1 Tax=Kingella kingae TaxID=504 RepID=UPI000571ABD0|nr:DNA polymerase IV [Kingella kingae]MDK4563971.1 DNA polymerase IV [Kingella kingae]MDK4578857.1 DNA polymerase IV [Kingella kingae]MDK4626604.1 DNA polymerase IV [Kingella kingae]MDK4675174.1 DNA polymerase IV [Kingella kingae]
MNPTRKIIHIDMDAFYASVELREQPHLRGLPVVVAWDGARSVICAASYEARQFGLRSAMPVATAKRLCPQAVFVPPHFDLYRQMSQQIHTIFQRYTDLIEPISLDEAYLDVTQNKQQLPYASQVAKQIRAEILAQTGLTASAGIAPNKFLAKIASDWRKPNGQFVIQPHEIEYFLRDLPVGKVWGVGKKTLLKMQQHGWQTIGDLRQVSRAELVHWFGKFGYRLYDLARGVDERPVQVERERLQISTEMTLSDNLNKQAISAYLDNLSKDLWQQMQRKKMQAYTLTLKLKSTEFQVFTRSQTYSAALPEQGLLQAALQLIARMPDGEFRLIGLGVSHLQPAGSQLELFG